MKKIVKAIFTVVLFGVFLLVAGCTSSLTDPIDFNALRYKYDVLKDSDGKQYVVLTQHLVSETDINIPENIYGVPVRKIGSKAFANDSSIKSVTLCSDLEAIGDFAFADCVSLNNVSYGRALKDIGDGAFSGCSALKSFMLCQNVTPSDALLTIGSGAFNQCSVLGSIDFYSLADEVGAYAFQGCTALTSFNMSDNANTIGRGAFYDCINLSDIKFPKGISDIGGMAFDGTAWLKAQSVKKEFVIVGDGVLIKYAGDDDAPELPKNVKKIAGAFAGNTAVTGVVINPKTTEIGDMAFYGCTSLISVDMPSSVTSIGSMAFASCSSLKTVYIHERTDSIAEDSFKHCYKATLYVARNSTAHKFCSENKLEYRFDD